MKWFPRGYGGKRRSPEEVKREGWRRQGVLVVDANDTRLTWPDREMIRQLGERLYGQHERGPDRGCTGSRSRQSTPQGSNGHESACAGRPRLSAAGLQIVRFESRSTGSCWASLGHGARDVRSPPIHGSSLAVTGMRGAMARNFATVTATI